MGECGVVLPANAPTPPDGLEAASWLIADQDSGEVLAAYAPHSRQLPAAGAKVLLAMVALRELNPDEVIVATREDTAQKGSRVGLVADGRYTVRDLTAALIVVPSTDVANAIARRLGGVQTTLSKINNLARELGARDTRITDPTGLDSPGMSTSAFDSALIFRAAMRNEDFATASGAKTVSITPQGKRAHKISRSNDNKLLASYDGLTGGKAGSTAAAKNTFVGTADRDGKRLVVTVLGSESAYEQASSLFDYGFDLKDANTEKTGTLDDSAGPAGPDDASSAVGLQGNDQAEDNRAVQDRSAFGNVGGFVVGLAGLGVLAAGGLTVRRKLARAKRSRANAASA